MGLSGTFDVPILLSQGIEPRINWTRGSIVCSYGRIVEEKRALRRSEIKLQFLSHQAPNMITILTELLLLIAMNMCGWRKVRKMNFGCFLFSRTCTSYATICIRENIKSKEATCPLVIGSSSKKLKEIFLRLNMPWRPIGMWDVEDPTLSRQSAHS
jgi:hypothetical protein